VNAICGWPSRSSSRTTIGSGITGSRESTDRGVGAGEHERPGRSMGAARWLAQLLPAGGGLSDLVRVLAHDAASGTTKVSTTFCSRARRHQRMRTVGCNGASDSAGCSTSIIGMRPDRCSIVFWDSTPFESYMPRRAPKARQLRLGKIPWRQMMKLTPRKG
jgi:hypothetical protein